jgi:hypothetical protein
MVDGGPIGGAGIATRNVVLVTDAERVFPGMMALLKGGIRSHT